jgi:hypothetical protein
LTAQLTTAFTNNLTVPDRTTAAENIANAYEAYARQAQSCALVPPSVTGIVSLKSALISSFNKENTTLDAAADDWANGFVAYWTSTVFGATGTVVFPGSASALQASLKGTWTAGFALVSIDDAASQLSSVLDAFTRTVTVRDSALPPPSG